MGQENLNSVILDARWFRIVNSPALFLTYDDGPNPEVTPYLLTLLDQFEVKATFFVTGESLNDDNSIDLLRLIVQRGHTIGNHGLLHHRQTCPRFDKMRDIIRSICGVDTHLVRAPYGSRSLLRRYFAENSTSVAIHWTRDFADWEPVDLVAIAEEIPHVVRPGHILLLHDGYVKGCSHHDRRHVLNLTELICRQARSRDLPVLGLASAFPHLYQKL